MRRSTKPIVVTLLAAAVVLMGAGGAAAYTVPVWDYVRTILDLYQGVGAQSQRVLQLLHEIEAVRAAYRDLKNFGGAGEWHLLGGMYGALSQVMNESGDILGYKSAQLDGLLEDTYPGLVAPDDWRSAHEVRLRRTLTSFKALLAVLDHDSRPNVRSELRLIASHDRQGASDGELEAAETGHVLASLKLNTEGRRLQALLARANIRALRTAYRAQEEAAGEQAFAVWSGSELANGAAAPGYGGVPAVWAETR